MNVTLEDLLKAIESEPEKKKRRKKRVGEIRMDYNHINRFIQDVGIVNGTTRVPTHVIFYHYRQKWTAVTNPVKLRYNPFFKVFHQKFNYARSGIQRYYLLDGSVFDLSREGKLEAKHYARQFKVRSKSKKKEGRVKVQKPQKGSSIES